LNHEDLNTNFLNVLREEAETALKAGDKETARALYKSLIRISFPVVEQEVRENPEIISDIKTEARLKGPRGEAAQVLLNHLNKKGLVP